MNGVWNGCIIVKYKDMIYKCYSVEDGYIRHICIYNDDTQIGELLKPNVVVDGKDEYRIYLKDEYSYLNNREYIDSFLQSRIDQYKDTSKMKIILSGSYVDIMDHLLDMNNPLHGRFKYKIKLEAFNYYEASNFYKNASLEDKSTYILPSFK